MIKQSSSLLFMLILSLYSHLSCPVTFLLDVPGGQKALLQVVHGHFAVYFVLQDGHIFLVTLQCFSDVFSVDCKGNVIDWFIMSLELNALNLNKFVFDEIVLSQNGYS